MQTEDYSVFRDCPFLLGSRAQDIAGFAAQQALRSGSQLQQMLTVRLPRRQAGQIRFAYRKRPYQWQLITAFLHTARTTVQPS